VFDKKVFFDEIKVRKQSSSFDVPHFSSSVTPTRIRIPKHDPLHHHHAQRMQSVDVISRCPQDQPQTDTSTSIGFPTSTRILVKTPGRTSLRVLTTTSRSPRPTGSLVAISTHSISSSAATKAKQKVGGHSEHKLTESYSTQTKEEHIESETNLPLRQSSGSVSRIKRTQSSRLPDRTKFLDRILLQSNQNSQLTSSTQLSHPHTSHTSHAPHASHTSHAQNALHASHASHTAPTIQTVNSFDETTSKSLSPKSIRISPTRTIIGGKPGRGIRSPGPSPRLFRDTRKIVFPHNDSEVCFYFSF
jgi:hypothetical protein